MNWYLRLTVLEPQRLGVWGPKRTAEDADGIDLLEIALHVKTIAGRRAEMAAPPIQSPHETDNKRLRTDKEE